MTTEEVNKLFAEYRKTKDIAIRNKIAEHYVNVADIVAKKFVNRGVEYDDLKQVAALALIRGIDRFDPELGMQFTTFITPTIAGEIKNHFRDKSRAVKYPRRLSEISMKVKACVFEQEKTTGKKPTVKELSTLLGFTEEEVVEALETGGTLSLDGINEDDPSASLYAVLPKEDGEFDKFEVRETVKSALKNLDETEQKIVKYRFEEELSQSETAKKLGVSQMFVSRLERKILERLRTELKDSV